MWGRARRRTSSDGVAARVDAAGCVALAGRGCGAGWRGCRASGSRRILSSRSGVALLRLIPAICLATGLGATRSVGDLGLVSARTIGTGRRAGARRMTGRSGRRSAAAGPVVVPLIVVVVMLVHDRQAVRVIAVATDAAPIPARTIESGAPVVGRPRVVAVPTRHQRCRRAPVVAPAAVRVVVEHEVAVDVVVPAAAPIHAGEGLDRFGIAVNVGDDLDAVAVGQRVVPEHRAVCGGRRGRGHGALDVGRVGHIDVVIRAGLGDHRARRTGSGGVGSSSTSAADQGQTTDQQRRERTRAESSRARHLDRHSHPVLSPDAPAATDIRWGGGKPSGSLCAG